MQALAEGRLDTAVPGIERRDEVGGMAGAVLVFKAAHDRRATGWHRTRTGTREPPQAAKQTALLAMAETIETEAKQALVRGRPPHRRHGRAAANGMSASATRTGASAQSAASAAAQALANAQTVASAAEQLAASIREIGGQVSQSSAVVGRAVEAGRDTRETIGTLNEKVDRIGSVADMISEIAARTNLLALERDHRGGTRRRRRQGVRRRRQRGEATRQRRPPSSTEEISRHIAEVRTATAASVTAVDQHRADHRRGQCDRRLDRRGGRATRRSDSGDRAQCQRDGRRGQRDDQPDQRGFRRSRADRHRRPAKCCERTSALERRHGGPAQVRHPSGSHRGQRG